MVQQTDYHGLDDYEDGVDESWDHSDLVQHVDRTTAKINPLADRPTSPPPERLYYATDVRTLFLYDPDHPLADADGWVAIGGTGTDTDPVPGTTYLEVLDVSGDVAVGGLVDGVDVSAHAADAAAHHAKYTDAEAVAALEAEDPLDLAGDLNVPSGGVGIGMAAGASPLEIQGNATNAFGIILRTLNDAGTTAEERTGLLYTDDAGNRLGNLTAHTHSNGHHISLYGYDGTHTGFKAFDVESNGEFNFGPDLSRVQAQSPVRIDTTELGALILKRTDSNSVKFNLVNQAGESIEFRQVGTQLRINGDDGNQIAQFNTAGPVRIWENTDIRGDLELNQNFLYLEDFNNPGDEYEKFANNGNLITRAPDGSNVLLVGSGGDVQVPGGDVNLADQGAVTGQDAHFSGHQTTDQTAVDTGTYINVAEATTVVDGPYTVTSPSEVTVGRAGLYEVEYTTRFLQTAGSNRSNMSTVVTVNGVEQTDRTKTTCYIRDTNGGGDTNTNSDSAILDLASGDVVRVYVWQEKGSQEHTVDVANLSMEYLG